MNKWIAVSGCELQITPSGAAGTASITDPASIKTKINGKGVYTSPLSIAVSGYMDSSGSVIAAGSGVGKIISTGQKIKDDGKLVMIEGDSISITLNGVNPITGIPVTFPVTVKISNAGQMSVKGI